VRKWDIFEDIKPMHGIAPVVVDDAAYLIVENASAVIRFDMKQRTSRTLVSTRRRPGESPLDITELWLSRIWKNERGEVVIAGETDPLSASQSRFTLAAWNPAEERWRTLQEAKLKSETTLPAMRANLLPLAGRVTGRNAVFNAMNLATAQPRANANSPLTLNFSTPVAGKKEIPIDFRLPPGLEPSRSDDGVRSMINVGPCLATPAGYVFPFSMGGPGFWFLTKAEFEAYCAPPQAARLTQ